MSGYVPHNADHACAGCVQSRSASKAVLDMYRTEEPHDLAATPLERTILSLVRGLEGVRDDPLHFDVRLWAGEFQQELEVLLLSYLAPPPDFAELVGTAPQEKPEGRRAANSRARAIERRDGVPMESGEPPAPEGEDVEAWMPTSANINALPEPIRRFIHDLETRCDPAGNVRELAIARDTITALQLQLDEAQRERNEAREYAALIEANARLAGDNWAKAVLRELDEAEMYANSARYSGEALGRVIAEVRRLRTVLEEDAAGRPLHELLSVAAEILGHHGGGPVEDCLRLKATELRALTPDTTEEP